MVTGGEPSALVPEVLRLLDAGALLPDDAVLLGPPTELPESPDVPRLLDTGALAPDDAVLLAPPREDDGRAELTCPPWLDPPTCPPGLAPLEPSPRTPSGQPPRIPRHARVSNGRIVTFLCMVTL
ncbi:MAG: hypothetical protein HY904_11895 [Deltaproteobacteria bacterium]|nr:hypothetical protein [Deltaproteobacteria bacterium]